jgi:hypothetical protein
MTGLMFESDTRVYYFDENGGDLNEKNMWHEWDGEKCVIRKTQRKILGSLGVDVRKMMLVWLKTGTYYITLELRNKFRHI